ncbi:MAG: winged helix-turn-helix transcriptional regulator [Candidatus Helarchaeota archaeon]|nr:winged helix-turn-helix transcriptional regulator [Candidatus Helarchaeota archaeon]
MFKSKRDVGIALTLLVLCAFLMWSVFCLGFALATKSNTLFASDNLNLSMFAQNENLIINDMSPASTESTEAIGVMVITQSQVEVAEGFVLSSFFIYFIIATNVSNYNLFPSQIKLNQSTRQQIYNIIEQNEGVHLREICRMLDKKMGVVQYHIYVLESANLINSLKDGRYKRFFVNHLDSPEKKIVISLLQRETTAKVLSLILQNNNNEGIAHSAIAKELDASSQAITWHIQKMMDAEVITVMKHGCQKYYQITPKFLPILESLM